MSFFTFRSGRLFLLTGLLFLVFHGFSSAVQNEGQQTPLEQDKETVRTWAKPRQFAKNVNFNKQLGLPFSSLETLGTRIDAARADHDPVALGHLANELALAEKVSGKKASITANLLFQEAAKMAQMRGQAPELKATSMLATQMQQPDAMIQELNKAVERANQLDSRFQKILAEGQPGDLKVSPVLISNATDDYIVIYLNGKLQVRIPPSQKQYLNLVQNGSPMVLMGYSTGDTWGPRTIYGTLPNYTWILLPTKSDSGCDD